MKIVKSNTTEYSIMIARIDSTFRITHDHVNDVVMLNFGDGYNKLNPDEFKQVQEFVIDVYDEINED